jgi:hypothetical protein
MLNAKDIIEKALGSLLVAAVIGLSTLMYKEFETYKEIRNLLEVRHELEEAFKHEVKDRKAINSAIVKRLQILENKHKKDSTTLKYTKEWVDYWVSLR